MRSSFPVTSIAWCVLMVVVYSFSGSYYVRSGSNGDGDNWEEAAPGLPERLKRGWTYYVADGLYSGGYRFDDPVKGRSFISVVKATESEHGTDSGWKSEYGDGIAKWVLKGGEGFEFNSHFYIFNGKKGGGPGNWKRGHGFEIVKKGQGDRGVSSMFFIRASGISVLHTHIHADQKTYTTGFDIDNKGKDIILSNNYMHDTFGSLYTLRGCFNLTIDKSYHSSNRSTREWHTNGISERSGSRRVTIKNSIWHEVRGTGVIAGINGGVSSEWKIYNNIFSNCVVPLRIVQDDDKNYAKEFMICHNAFVNATGSQGAVYLEGKGHKGVKVYNNIWYHNRTNTISLETTQVHDYNYFYDNYRPNTGTNKDRTNNEPNQQIGSYNPFENWDPEQEDPGETDIRMREGFSIPGIKLKGEFSRDMYGNKRVKYSRGPIEEGSGNK